MEVEQKILQVCQRLHARNMLAAADGNVSYRYSDDKIVITPTGKAKAFIEEKDLATINIKGEFLKGTPSGEYLMHLEVYRRCPLARAIVHAHPPTAIAWSIARPYMRELPAKCLPEVILATGRVPIVPYARPTTQDMAIVLEDYLPDHKVMILSRHGGLSWGENLEEAYWGMERIEHCAEILKRAEDLGELSELPRDEIDALKAMRKEMGNRSL